MGYMFKYRQRMVVRTDKNGRFKITREQLGIPRANFPRYQFYGLSLSPCVCLQEPRG